MRRSETALESEGEDEESSSSEEMPPRSRSPNTSGSARIIFAPTSKSWPISASPEERRGMLLLQAGAQREI